MIAWWRILSVIVIIVVVSVEALIVVVLVAIETGIVGWQGWIRNNSMHSARSAGRCELTGLRR